MCVSVAPIIAFSVLFVVCLVSLGLGSDSKKFIFLMIPGSPIGTPALNPLPSPQVAATAAAAYSTHAALTPREAGWRPPPPVQDEPEVWSAQQAERVAEALRQASLDPAFRGRFRPNHVSDLADDVTAYAVLVAATITRPDAGLMQRVDFGRMFHRIARRVRDTLGAEQYSAAVVNEVRARLHSVPGIPMCGEPVCDRRPRTRGRFSTPRGPSRALSLGMSSRRAHSPPPSSTSSHAPSRGGRGARGGFGGRRGGR